MPIYPSPPSMLDIPSEDGYWQSYSGSYPQQYHRDLAGGGGVFLPLPMLKSLSTRVPQSCLSRNRMGTAGSETGAKAKGAAQFFETYRACVLTLRNAPEWPALKTQLGLSLKELVESTYGDIFPPRVFLAKCNAPPPLRLGSILQR